MAVRPDSDVQRLYEECQNNYDVGDDTAEWPNNLVSKRAVALSSGRLIREGDPFPPEPSPARVEELRALSAEVAAMMDGLSVCMGSESDDPWFPLWVAAGESEDVPQLTGDTAPWLVGDWWFGKTIFPGTTVAFLPVEGPDGLLEAMSEDEADDDEGETDFRAMAALDQLLAWLREDRFEQAGLLMIGDAEDLQDMPSEKYPEGTEIPGCVHPRAFVGQLSDGSLVGVFGYVVMT